MKARPAGFLDEGSKGFLFKSNVFHKTSGESVRFNQCQREWHTRKGNAFEADTTAPRIATAAEPPIWSRHTKRRDPDGGALVRIGCTAGPRRAVRCGAGQGDGFWHVSGKGFCAEPSRIVTSVITYRSA